MKALVIPKGNSQITGINSYYLDIPKFLEHYSETPFSGMIHFKSFQSEGVVFLDAENVLSGLFLDGGGLVEGREAVARIVNSGETQNYTIDLVELHEDKVHYWTSLANLEEIHSGLSSEFTDLEALIKKMSNEQLNGYIEVVQGDKVQGYIFFRSGSIMTDPYHISDNQVPIKTQDMETLIAVSREKPSVFNVARVPARGEGEVEEITAEAEDVSSNSLEMLEELLLLMQKLIEGNKKIKAGFETLLRKKFMEKVQTYEFLDPFAAEFVYENGKITYVGSSDEEDLAHGILDCVREIASETGMTGEFARSISAWKEKYAEEIGRYGLVV